MQRKPVTKLLVFLLLLPFDAVGANGYELTAWTQKIKGFADVPALIAKGRIHNNSVIDRQHRRGHQIIRYKAVLFQLQDLPKEIQTLNTMFINRDGKVERHCNLVLVHQDIRNLKHCGEIFFQVERRPMRTRKGYGGDIVKRNQLANIPPGRCFGYAPTLCQLSITEQRIARSVA